jgi:hypothetical protein
MSKERPRMDQAHARALLAGERARAERLLAAESQRPAASERGAMVEEADGAVGLASARHPCEVLEGADITPEEQLADEEDEDEPAPEPTQGIRVQRDDWRR